MEVEYSRRRFRSDSSTERDSVSSWLESNLETGGIESQIRKLTALLVLVGEQWFISNPDRLDDVAQAIECDGWQHRLIDSES